MTTADGEWVPPTGAPSGPPPVRLEPVADDLEHSTGPGPHQVELSVLVPVKDEVASLAQLTAEITAALDGRVPDEVAGATWELLFVDDGSADGSWDEIVRLGNLDERVRGLRLRRNLGKSAALAAGLEASTGRIIATLDGDLQDDPAELPGMIARLGRDADLVAGHKAQRKDPLGKRLPSKVFNLVTGAVTGLKLHDHNCGLKVARREVFTSVRLYGEMHRFLASISHAQGFRVVEQPVNHRPRQHGRSKFGLERYARGGLDLLTVLTLTRYSRRPAHLFGGVGIVVGVIGMAILLYLSGVWLLTDRAIGSRPLLLMGVLFVILAVQLTSLGLIAEMIVSRDARDEDPLRHVMQRANL
jgi:glycosyltransferase involved in cell wall biosynthesis